MGQKKAVTVEIQGRYIKATKKDKSKILDEFSATTGYNRFMQQEFCGLSQERQ